MSMRRSGSPGAGLGRAPGGLYRFTVVGLLAASFALAGIASPGAQQDGADTPAIAELRLFLSTDPGLARGEIVTADPYPSDPIAVALEDGVVMFRDDGSGPDRAAGDGVFTAHFAFDTTSTFEVLKARLGRSMDVLRNPGNDAFVHLGPRDIVPVADAIADGGALSPGIIDTLRRNEDRVSRFLENTDPLLAAKAGGVDIAETPLWRVGMDTPAIEYLFDIPVLTDFPSAGSQDIDWKKSLLVVDERVLDDPLRSFDACADKGTRGGAWSFGHLMRELARGSGVSPEEFTKRWLETWKVRHPDVNGWVVEPRNDGDALQHIFDLWSRLSGDGELDVDYFPARLLAIVNRPDLASQGGPGSDSAGEGRLVFGLQTADCVSVGFTVIFEYVVPGPSCPGIKAWQRRWKDLDRFEIGSDDYALALEQVTRAFTDRMPDAAGSLLARVRTNENVLGIDWQMREFILQDDGLLGLVPVKQTVANSLNDSAALAEYLRDNEAKILKGRHVVPERFPAAHPFLGAVADVSSELFFWSAPVTGLVDPIETRRRFSLATCNGCHAGETETGFTHLGQQGRREHGESTKPSGSMTGKTVRLPLRGGKRRYDDLAERRQVMSNILQRECFMLLGLQRSPFVH